MRVKLEKVLSLWRPLAALACLLLAMVGGAAQSSDLNYPTPLYTNEIEGRIAPRDLGDPRLTSHFYTFNGTQGDIVITVESRNLDGAVDLFLTQGLRPLTQITLFSSGSALDVTKSVFLRAEEAIILRVQARTPNDADGSYRIRLSGTFQPSTLVAATPPQPEETPADKLAARPAGRGTHRVNSVGARIEEPEPAAPEVTGEEEKRAEAPARAPTTPTRTPRRGTSRRTRTDTARTRTPERKTEPSTKEPEPPAGEETVRTEPAEPTPTKAEPARTPRTTTGRTARNTRGRNTARRTREPAKEPAAGTPPETADANAPPAPTVVATRLIIEVRDGPRVEHEMSAVSRVTVVGGLIVVILKNGRIERYPLTSVLRMAIEP